MSYSLLGVLGFVAVLAFVGGLSLGYAGVRSDALRYRDSRVLATIKETIRDELDRATQPVRVEAHRVAPPQQVVVNNYLAASTAPTPRPAYYIPIPDDPRELA